MQLKRNRFFIVNTTVKISTLEHRNLYCIKYGVLYLFYSFGQPFEVYGLDIESLFTTYTGDKIKVFNSAIQDSRIISPI